MDTRSENILVDYAQTKEGSALLCSCLLLLDPNNGRHVATAIMHGRQHLQRCSTCQARGAGVWPGAFANMAPECLVPPPPFSLARTRTSTDAEARCHGPWPHQQVDALLSLPLCIGTRSLRAGASRCPLTNRRAAAASPRSACPPQQCATTVTPPSSQLACMAQGAVCAYGCRRPCLHLSSWPYLAALARIRLCRATTSCQIFCPSSLSTHHATDYYRHQHMGDMFARMHACIWVFAECCHAAQSTYSAAVRREVLR